MAMLLLFGQPPKMVISLSEEDVSSKFRNRRICSWLHWMTVTSRCMAAKGA